MATRQDKHKRRHLILTIVWAVIGILAIAGGVLELFGIQIAPLLWLLGVAFISLCSIYANFAAHWAAYEASS